MKSRAVRSAAAAITSRWGRSGTSPRHIPWTNTENCCWCLPAWIALAPWASVACAMPD